MLRLQDFWFAHHILPPLRVRYISGIPLLRSLRLGQIAVSHLENAMVNEKFLSNQYAVRQLPFVKYAVEVLGSGQ